MAAYLTNQGEQFNLQQQKKVKSELFRETLNAFDVSNVPRYYKKLLLRPCLP